jgi:hypothetical protein
MTNYNPNVAIYIYTRIYLNISILSCYVLLILPNSYFDIVGGSKRPISFIANFLV